MSQFISIATDDPKFMLE